MPLIVSTSCGYRPNSTIACLIECSTPKSPHPGHQSGSACPFRSLTVSAGRSRSISRTMCGRPLDQDLVPWHVAGGFFGQNRLHAIHDVVRHEGLAVVLANVSVGDKACFRTQVASELSAVVVLHDDHAAGFAKLLHDRVRVERDQPL